MILCFYEIILQTWGVMLPQQHQHPGFSGTRAVGLKVEAALQPYLSLCWWCTPPRGLATWPGTLELVWDPTVEMWGACALSETSSR